MVAIGFLRRLLGPSSTPEPDEADVVSAPAPRPKARSASEPTNSAAPAPVRPTSPEPEAQPASSHPACPYCAQPLDPPPTSTRLCLRCRRRIVVRHVEGRAVYLTEAAVTVFDAERKRRQDEETWGRQRREWLQLAQIVGAPAERRRRLAAARLTAASVEAARRLYLTAADAAVRTAKRERRWQDVARLRARQAEALFEDAGKPVPLPEEVVRLRQEAAAATLRDLATVSRQAELVGSGCCAICRADDERIFPITEELRTPRLPHAGCPRGLCECDWWPVTKEKRIRRKRRPTTASAAPGPEPATPPEPPAQPV